MFASQSIVLRPPTIKDGSAVHHLVERCPPLDANSTYCNILQCGHFSATSVAALSNLELVGFISAYCVPDRKETLFIWQVAVDECVRGRGLASQMIESILSRASTQDVTYIETTITEENKGSWALFKKLAKQLDAPMTATHWLDKSEHFGERHPSESLVRIGPFTCK